MTQLRDALSLIERAAPGSSAVVSAPGAEPVSLADARAAEVPEVEDRDELLELLSQAVRRDAEGRQQLDAVATKVAAALETMSAAMASVAEVVNLQKQLIESTRLLAETLARPQVPVYDAKGKLIGVKRVDKLGDEQ